MEISNAYINRLVKEWKAHGKIIIACDFDDTISPWNMHEYNFDRVILLLREAQLAGAYIVIWTASDVERYPAIKAYCESKDLKIDAINENVLELPYGNNKKIYANIYLDDRAGLTESMEILGAAMKEFNKFNKFKNGRNRKV